MTVALVNPPSPPGQTVNREGAGGLGALSSGEVGFLYPPQMLAYCAAALRSNGYSVRLIDAAGKDAAGRRYDAAGVIEMLAARPPAVIAVHVAYISLQNDIDFLRGVRRALPGCTVIAIGPSIPFVAEQIERQTDIQCLLYGEPEALLPALCRALGTARQVARLGRRVGQADLQAPGVDGNGRLQDLDSLPLPAWDLVDRQAYGFLTMQASRGCADGCLYCPYVVGQGVRLRARSPAAVAEELAWLVATFHPTRVIMRDPVFAYDAKRTQIICRQIITRGVRVAWECESRPEHFTPELLELMSQAGCTAVKLGLESSGEALLRGLRRLPAGHSAAGYLSQAASTVKACRRLNMACRVFVMTGLPGQTDQDITETLAVLRHIGATTVHVKPFCPYPGLRLGNQTGSFAAQRGEQQARRMEAEIATWSPVRPTLAQRLAARVARTRAR